MKNFLIIAFILFGATTVSAQSKIAHLNSQLVMEAMPSYNDAVKKLEAFQVEMNTEFQAMIADYQKTVEALQRKMDELSPVMLQIEKERLAKKEQALAEREQSIQKDIEAYSRELNLPILTMVENAVKTVSNRNNYDYVFDVSTLMIHKGPDITQEVITEILKLEKEAAMPPQEEVRP